MTQQELTVNLNLPWWAWLSIAALILLAVGAKWFVANYEMRRTRAKHDREIEKIKQDHDTLNRLGNTPKGGI